MFSMPKRRPVAPDANAGDGGGQGAAQGQQSGQVNASLWGQPQEQEFDYMCPCRPERTFDEGSQIPKAAGLCVVGSIACSRSVRIKLAKLPGEGLGRALQALTF